MPETKDLYPKDGARRSPCPVANALDLVGDKWSLLVVRDLIDGHGKTFGALLSSPERIPTNLLADRLKRLERAGLVKLSAYSERPPRYEYSLSARGMALGPVLAALVRWGKKQFPGTLTLNEIRTKKRQHREDLQIAATGASLRGRGKAP